MGEGARMVSSTHVSPCMEERSQHPQQKMRNYFPLGVAKGHDCRGGATDTAACALCVIIYAKCVDVFFAVEVITNAQTPGAVACHSYLQPEARRCNCVGSRRLARYPHCPR
jgi:hypothetical protein